MDMQEEKTKIFFSVLAEILQGEDQMQNIL